MGHQQQAIKGNFIDRLMFFFVTHSNIKINLRTVLTIIFCVGEFKL